MKKTTVLLAIIAVLSALILFLGLSRGKRSTIDIGEDAFALEDAAGIDRFVIYKAGKIMNYFNRTATGRWVLNDSVPVDDEMADLLFKVLGKVKVKKNLPSAQQDTLSAGLEKEAFKIELYEEGQVVKEMYLDAYSGNRQLTLAKLVNGDPYLVTVPGFEHNLADLIGLSATDWKDRIIFSSNWRSLLQVKVDYPGQAGKSFEINYRNGFFKVPGIQQIDTAKVIGYLDNFSQFRVGAFLDSAENLLADSLKLEKEYCRISITDVDSTKNRHIVFFPPRNNDLLIYGKTGWDEQYFMIPRNMAEMLMPGAEMFKKQ